MKFSPISLIAVVLAAIAGSTIAAPDPLHSRALVVDNLFKRQPTPNDDWRENHRIVAEELLKSSFDNYEASHEALATSRSQTNGIKSPEEWEAQAYAHDMLSRMHARMSLKHFDALKKEEKGTLYDKIDQDYRAGLHGRRMADLVSFLAKADRRLQS